LFHFDIINRPLAIVKKKIIVLLLSYDNVTLLIILIKCHYG
jgi:hypothetical protein